MTEASSIRRLLNLFEAEDTSYQGKLDDPSVSYSAEMKAGGEITKVTAFLSSYQSGKYTKLGRTLNRVERLEARIKTLKEETKAETKEMLQELFHAEDAACTRVVDTVSFVFQMSKDPKPTETVKYSKVLEELQNQLTPDLQKVLETLIAKHTSAPVQKSPSLKTTDKAGIAQEGIAEGAGDQLKGFFAKLKNWVNSWGAKYDQQLNALKAQLNLGESLEEDSSGFRKGDEVIINSPESSGHGEIANVDSFDSSTGLFKVYLQGTGFHGFYQSHELKLHRVSDDPNAPDT